MTNDKQSLRDFLEDKLNGLYIRAYGQSDVNDCEISGKEFVIDLIETYINTHYQPVEPKE